MFKLELTEHQINIILVSLSKEAWNAVNPVILEITRQINEQKKEKDDLETS